MPDFFDNNIRHNWKLMLTLAMARGLWAIEPREAVAAPLVLRDWDGMDNSSDLENARGRDPLPVSIITPSGYVEKKAKKGDANPWDKAPDGSTAIVPVKGTMLKYSTLCTYGTEEIAGIALEAAASKKVNSIVLDIDSGGGAVDAVAPIVQAIKKIQSIYNKPVVSSCDMAASAAYWTASACDEVIANNDISAAFGSIGVMCSFIDVQPYWEELGYKFHTIYAPESTEKNAAFEAALKGEYDKIKTDELSPLAQSFQNAVKNNRQKLKLDTPHVLNGKMFFHDDALKAGLIDHVGDFSTALKRAQKLAEKYTLSAYVKS